MKQRAEKDRISAVLFIVVFLLVVVIVIMVLKTVDDKRAAQNAQEQATINTQDYQPPVQDPNAMVDGGSSVTPNPYAPVNTLPGGNSGPITLRPCLSSRRPPSRLLPPISRRPPRAVIPPPRTPAPLCP